MDLFDIILIGILIFFVLVIVIIIIVIFALRAGYKHTFLRKIVTGGRLIKISDKAKEFKKKDGTILWKLLKAKHTINRPPPEVIDTDDRGNFFVEAFYLGDINYIYSKDELENKDKIQAETENIIAAIKILSDKIQTLEKAKEQTEHIKKDIENLKIHRAKLEAQAADLSQLHTFQELEIMSETIKRDLKFQMIETLKNSLFQLKKKALFDLAFFKPSPVYIYQKDEYIPVQNFKPITSNQRIVGFDSMKKAFDRKQKGWQQHLPLMIAFGSIIILFAIFFIFGGELIQPVADLHRQQTATADNMIILGDRLVEASTKLDIIINDRQFIDEQAKEPGTVQILNKEAPN